MSMEGGDRGAHRHRLFFRSRLLPQGLGHRLADGGRTFWSSWCMTWEKPMATTELCPVASIRQKPKTRFGTKRGGGGGGGQVARQNLVPLSNLVLCHRETESSRAPGLRAHLS